MRHRILLTCAFFCSAACPLVAKTIWVLQGFGNTLLAPCQAIIWRPDVVFHNRSAADATVHPVHVSNQPSGTMPLLSPFIVPAGSSAVPGTYGAIGAWIAQ